MVDKWGSGSSFCDRSAGKDRRRAYPSSPASPTKETIERSSLFLFVGDGFPVPILAKTEKTPWNPTSLDPKGGCYPDGRFYLFATISTHFRRSRRRGGVALSLYDELFC